MNSPTKLKEAVLWLQQNLTFDIDHRVHVFEVNIRALGTLPQNLLQCCKPFLSCKLLVSVLVSFGE